MSMAQPPTMPPGTEPSIPGTRSKTCFDLCHDFDRETIRFVTFALQPGCDNFSLEEHRLADYQKAKNLHHPKKAVAMSAPKFKKSEALKLFRGKAVEICVGPTPSQDEVWSLPVKMISHHSPYFKTHYLWKNNGQINLPEHDPAVFGMFVEWMYYGSYNSSILPTQPNINAKCWVLGDYLLCNNFKNYALDCLYKEHTRPVFRVPVSFEDVQYVCNNTSSDSKLKWFYLDFVLDHFGDPCWLHGDMSEWEEFLQDQPDVRSALLQKLRFGPPKEPHVKFLMTYQEPWDLASESPLKKDTNVDGLPVKNGEDKASEL